MNSGRLPVSDSFKCSSNHHYLKKPSMKKLLLTSFAAAAFMLQAKAQTFTHAVVPVTGFTADVIADGSGSAANSTNADVDGQNYNFVAQNFVSPTNSSPTTFLPTGGLLNSLVTAGMPFQL